MRHICKMEKLEIRAVIKYFCKKGMPPMGYVMCVRRRDLQSIASELGISFGAVQSILTDILGMSNVSARWVPRMLTEDQKRIFLCISCLAMKMIRAILSSEL